MGAVRMGVQADKNITIIHTTPVHVLCSEKLRDCKKQIHHEGILSLNSHFWP